MEKETMGSEELIEIVERTSPEPKIVPGTEVTAERSISAAANAESTDSTDEPGRADSSG
ncbi:MAG: hypothetical protein IIA35_04600 [Proteobacteria bacterium]|nr:hypothetical protein [Pseudomonadota bacterium]